VGPGDGELHPDGAGTDGQSQDHLGQVGQHHRLLGRRHPVTYSYKVTNTGNVTLTSVGVSDPMTGLSAISCPSSTLAPGGSETCTATYATTQANVDAGSLTNTGTATGTPPSGPAVTASSSVTIPASQSPAVALVKSASITNYSAAGTPVTYSYKVTNSGNVTLTSVGVTDPMTGLSAISCRAPLWRRGRRRHARPLHHHPGRCRRRFAHQHRHGHRHRPVGQQGDGHLVGDGARATASPKITVVKSANVSSYSGPGTVVTYSYKVTNTATSPSPRSE